MNLIIFQPTHKTTPTHDVMFISVQVTASLGRPIV